MTTKSNDKLRCITRREMANKKGDERWGIGAEIWLDEEIAQKHYAKGNIFYADEVTPPKPPAPTVKVNKAAPAKAAKESK